MLDLALGYLAVGIDPSLTTICVQSALPALCELTQLFLNLVTVARLERNPTIKEEIQARGFGRDIPAGFLCYPVYASLKRFDSAWNRSGITPAVFLPVYPDCSIRFRDDTAVVASPIRVFGGSGDDYNPAAICAAYMERLKAVGADVSLTVFPGAQHVFDNPAGPPQPTVAKGAQTVRGCSLHEAADGAIVEGLRTPRSPTPTRVCSVIHISDRMQPPGSRH